MMTINQLQHALRLHQQGMLDAAYNAYQDLLKKSPRDINVLNFLGILCFQRKNVQEGVKYLRKCLQLKPDFAQAHNNLGNGLMQSGMLKDAIQCFSRAVALAPDYAEAHHNLASAYGKHKDFERAILHARKSVQYAPHFAPGWAALASAHYCRKEFVEALSAAEHAESLSPGLPEAVIVKARVLWNQGNGIDAIALFRTVIGKFRSDDQILREFCSYLLDAGRPDEALPHLEHLIQLTPDDGLCVLLLGTALKALGEMGEAESALRKAAALLPDLIDAHLQLSQLLQAQGKYQEAEAAAKRALTIDPSSQNATIRSVSMLFEMDRSSEGFALLERFLELHPDDTDMLSQLLVFSNYSEGVSTERCLRMAVDYGRLVSQRVTVPVDSWLVDRQPSRLRVGLVSGDIRQHPVGLFLQDVLPKIDRERIELIGYPTQREIDALTLRLLPSFSAWKQLSGMGDQAAADMIRSDGIHVLIDLSGHTAHNRLPLFAWKPAPVQVSWLGYWATTGVCEIDYFLADVAGLPRALEGQFVEQIWRLPETRLCFSRPETDARVASLPALTNGYVTFGSFQSLKKIQMPVLKLWAKVLSEVPGARLRIQSPPFSDPTVMAGFRQRFEAIGGDPGRLDLHGPVRRADYLEAQREVDLILDTFPFPGGTTTCEALWMGVPTLSLAGSSLVARQGASILAAAGLPDWVAESESAYVEKAQSFTADLPALSTLRLSLRDRVAGSALFDAERFARNFEQALMGMWQGYEEGRRVDSVVIPQRTS